MPQYIPTHEFDNSDFIYEYANSLRNDLASLDFPSREASENKRVLNGLISFWHHGIAEPADLFIPSTQSDARKQLELMQAELDEILERQDKEISNIFVPFEPGEDIPCINNSHLINKETHKALQDYIDEIKRVHEL